MATAKILVTGAAGFIGSHLVESLLHRGRHVVGIDNFDPSYDRDLKARNLTAAVADPRFTLEEVDIRDARAVEGVLQRHCPRQVLHFAAKADAEVGCQAHVAATGMPVTCLRLFTVYGPRQRPDLAIHRFVRAIAERRPLTLFGDGSSRRDYTHVSDIVAGVQAALESPAGFRVFNLGRGEPATLADTVRTIEEALGQSAAIERLPPQEGDLDQTWADISLARRELRFEPTTEWRDGIRDFVAWRKNARSNEAGPCAAL